MVIAKAHSDAFHAIADPTRRAILELLAPGGVERTAGELGSPFGLGQPTISQHLKVLRESGLVSVRDEGRCRIYQLETGPLQPLQAWLGRVVEFADPAGQVWRVRNIAKED